MAVRRATFNAFCPIYCFTIPSSMTANKLPAMAMLAKITMDISSRICVSRRIRSLGLANMWDLRQYGVTSPRMLERMQGDFIVADRLYSLPYREPVPAVKLMIKMIFINNIELM